MVWPGGSRHKPAGPRPESLTILQGFEHQQQTEQRPNPHPQGTGRGGGAGSAESAGQARGAAAGAWDATAGEFGFGEEHSFGRKV